MKIFVIKNQYVLAHHVWVDATLTEAERMAFLQNKYPKKEHIDYDILCERRGRQLLHVYLLADAVLRRFLSRQQYRFFERIIVETQLHAIGRAMAHRYKLTDVFFMCLIDQKTHLSLSVHKGGVLHFFKVIAHKKKQSHLGQLRYLLACYEYDDISEIINHIFCLNLPIPFNDKKSLSITIDFDTLVQEGATLRRSL